MPRTPFTTAATHRAPDHRSTIAPVRKTRIISTVSLGILSVFDGRGFTIPKIIQGPCPDMGTGTVSVSRHNEHAIAVRKVR